MSSPDAALNLAPVWRRRAAGYLALARISNSPTVITNVLAGAALATTAEPTAKTIPLVLAVVLFYTAGMFLNDVCDYAIDCRERPERPLPSAAVSRTAAAASAVVMLAAGSAVLLAVSAASFVSGLVLVALIVAYDLWHKRNRLSPVLMAGTRMLVYVTAFVAFADTISAELVVAAVLLGLYVIALTAIAKAGASGAVVQRLIAGIALFDAIVLAVSGAPVAAVCAVGAFAATVLLQRFVAGT